MDNLTHSLIGAAIGQTGLKKLSGLGMPTLIIAANIPDIDAACLLWLDGVQHLGFRRGITHGPPAMIILPVLLTLAMVAFDRGQTKRGTRPEGRLPVRPWNLLLLAFIGCVSHPAFDWLNNYGIRLLEPFSSQWFYGDTLFIIDAWLLAILIGGWFWTSRAERAGRNWMRRGQIVATVMALYIFGNGLITGHAEAWAKSDAPYPEVAVANAVPFKWWVREVEWRGNDRRGRLSYSLFAPLPARDQSLSTSEKVGMDDQRIAAIAARDADVRTFLFWSRMPYAVFEKGELVIRDQRFSNPALGDRFAVRAKLLPEEMTP
jgi:inner membrane protein